MDFNDFWKEARTYLYDIIKVWAQEVPTTITDSLPEREPLCGISVSSIRNGRRKMEDRHVVLPYLSALYPSIFVS